MSGSSQTTPSAGRVLSIDALRGFDLFWITGGREALVALVVLLGAVLPGAWTEWLRQNIDWQLIEQQMTHVDWVGFTAWDLIMPLFLFIVGAAMPFSFAKRLEQSGSKRGLYLRVLRRVLVLWVLGMVVQGNLLQIDHWLPQVTDSQFNGHYSLHVFSNTLQAIAVGYLVASIALMHLPVSGQAALTGLLLILSWLLMKFVPFGGTAAGVIEPNNSLAWFIDEAILRRFRDGTTYTWILSGLGFAATTLLGAFAGHLLRSGRSNARKFLWLIAFGAITLMLGLLWHGQFRVGSLPVDLEGPWQCLINKHIWSSSMALYAAGWSYWLLALFFLGVDVLRLRRTALFFTVIGANAIFAYVIRAGGSPWVLRVDGGSATVPNRLVPFELLIHNILGGGIRYLKTLGDPWPVVGATVLPVLSFALLWILLLAMYRKRIFLRA